jgi:anti-sigma B factor antagonist
VSLSEFAPTYLELAHDGDVTIARFTIPRLSEDENIERIGHELFLLVEQYDRRKVVLNLHEVEYLTSSALGKLITLHRKLHRQQGRLVICHMLPEVEEVMRSSRLIDYFNTAHDVAGAVAALQPQ